MWEQPGLGELAARAPLLVSAAAVAALLALALFLRLRGARQRGAEPVEASAGSFDALLEENRDLRKTIWQLQAENRNLANFFVLLPDFTRQLNSHLAKRKIAPLLIQIIDFLFDPAEVTIFFASRSGDRLVLAAKKGLGPEIELDAAVPFGEGRVGWVARHQMTMSGRDFAAEAQIPQADRSPLDRVLGRVELCAPMVHDTRTLGAIALGGTRKHPKNDKQMLKMVADFGTIALNNAILFRKMESSANSDGLTSLTNKRHFLVRLGEEIFKAGKTSAPLSIFIFDIDHFKNYNDANGHLAGDEALKITGRILREATREDDLVARYGGEEFVVLLPGTDKEGAHKAAEKIREAIENFPYPNGRGQPLGRVSISGGVAAFPEDGRTSTELISAADQALYRAKNAGRNRVFLHEPKYLSEEEDTFYYERQEL